MSALRLLAAPLRSLLRFPLLQLAIVIAVVVLLQSADEHTLFGQMFVGLDRLVDRSVGAVSAAFSVKSFTKSWLTTGFWIGYVYLAGLLILLALRIAFALALDLAGRWNVFWLRNSIARERGIAAYQAWEPLERIRPPHISQEIWEEAFAWPANNKPPYPPLPHRLLRGLIGYIVVLGALAAALQLFTPLPALTWLGDLAKRLSGLR